MSLRCSTDVFTVTADAPLSVGCAESVDTLREVVIHHIADDGHTYTVPTGCRDRQYTAPIGIGLTMTNNNIVLMYLCIGVVGKYNDNKECLKY